MSLTLSDVEAGATISFRSKNPTDQVVWRGTLESRGTFRSIRSYMDPRSYNEAVRQSDATVPSDVTLLNFFLITVDNQSTDPQIMVFAEEWIKDGSLIEIALAKQITIRVDDPNNDTQRILATLAEAGYSSTILS
jgi:hypothetical protein